ISTTRQTRRARRRSSMRYRTPSGSAERTAPSRSSDSADPARPQQRSAGIGRSAPLTGLGGAARGVLRGLLVSFDVQYISLVNGKQAGLDLRDRGLAYGD